MIPIGLVQASSTLISMVNCSTKKIVWSIRATDFCLDYYLESQNPVCNLKWDALGFGFEGKCKNLFLASAIIHALQLPM
jgi:hypothetical protein